ncbi:MAG: hypothetical protein ACE5ID_11805, partial [Acidobacteriota bacterium]
MFQWTRCGVEDRWHDSQTPGSYEWWGYEAVDRERGLSFSLRIAAGEPMDPRYARRLSREDGRGATLPIQNVVVRVVLYHGRK